MKANWMAQVSHIIPELIMVMTMVGSLALEATYKTSERKRGMVFSAVLIGQILALLMLALNLDKAPLKIFTNSIVIDPFSTLVKIVMILGGVGVTYLAHQSKDIYEGLKAEFLIMMVGVIVGGMVLASATNMLTIFIGVETLSILSYVLAAFKKYHTRSGEAGLKYALYGGVSAGVMLFGISHLYGLLGTIDLSLMATKIPMLAGKEMGVFLISFLCFFAGLGFKIACFPFHMWTPDVYEGAPIPVTAFFSIVPKVAGLAATARVVHIFFSESSPLQDKWVGIFQVIIVLTMFVGNITAIGQKSVKRMLAYSSISHAGFMLLGAIAMEHVGLMAMVFYAMVYLFMTLVVFAVTSFISDHYGNDHFERFEGLIYKHPIVSVVMITGLFSLAGLPPLSGFVAKFHVISAAISKEYYFLATMAIINSVIALFYYLRPVRLMVFCDGQSADKISGFNFVNQLLIVVLCVPVVLLGIFWDQMIAWAKLATLQ